MNLTDFEKYVDLSNSDKISQLTLKTSNTNQNFYEKNLIPSIESAVFLKNKYEVIEVTEDYNGTLENLMKIKGKKVPKTLPFINVLLVGGGSSGGWYSYDESGSYSEHPVLSQSMGGEINSKIFRNFDLKNDSFIVKIGKGGASLPEEITLSNRSDDNFSYTRPHNEGENSFFYFLKNENNKLESKGGKLNYKLMYESYPIGWHAVKDLDNSNMGISSWELGVSSYSSGKSIFEINTDDLLYFNKFAYNSIPFNFDNRIGNISVGAIGYERELYRGEGFIYRASKYMTKNAKDFIDNVQKNYTKALETETYNEYGALLTVGLGTQYRIYFFDGVDGKYPGEGGFPGTIVSGLLYNSIDNKSYFSCKKYCGKGGDGVCYIYYPSEV